MCFRFIKANSWTLIYFNLLLSSICLDMFLFWNIMKILFGLLCVVNDQPCCKVNLGTPCILLVAPAFWNTAALPQEIPLKINIPWKDDDYPTSLEILVWQGSILIFALLYLIRKTLLFLRKVCEIQVCFGLDDSWI